MQTTGILILLVQIAFAVHALRRGYPLFWIFLIAFVPVLGCLLYVAMVLLPEALGSRAARQGSKTLRKVVDPGKELRQRREALEISDTVGNRTALAREYLRQGMPDEAVRLYESALSGIYRTDPNLLLELTSALIAVKRFREARETLDILFQANPDFDNSDARLLYARALEETGETEKALEHYSSLLKASSGAEVKCRYALLLNRAGQASEARALFEEILRDAKAGSSHSHRLNREWVETARRELG